ncbi:acyl-coenzyme A thioesterase THEM4-like isoform X3 [Hemicordylus capensis]|nr:acyl-coenzyme A thioesterase THEM4-like isoform X3 [Hemicordylus capensis]XP_053134603.1 acyl-coenzyme A thioesterase THEM4-like isoform X3 [Hemicordylus capensis]XP_053134604.1 acyl-coenzyme A thioesterase THEM4-like isoform X3 [Hemicordylus capensis]
MQGVLRSCSRLAQGRVCWTHPSCGPWVAASERVLLRSTPLRNTTVRLCEAGQAKDYSLPNSSWSREMLDQFHKFMEMSKNGTWKKLPSYRSLVEHGTGKKRKESKEVNTRLFLRNFDTEGVGFEYVMFVNPLEKRMVSVFQLGPYLEGPPGLAHGGSIATILDSTLGGCAITIVGKVMTANLNINYRSPVPLRSVVLVDCKLESIEGRKVLVSGQVRGTDGQTLHAEATALFIKLESKKLPQPPASST